MHDLSDEQRDELVAPLREHLEALMGAGHEVAETSSSGRLTESSGNVLVLRIGRSLTQRLPPARSGCSIGAMRQAYLSHLAVMAALACNEPTPPTPPAAPGSPEPPAAEPARAPASLTTPGSVAGTVVEVHDGAVALTRAFDPPTPVTPRKSLELSLRSGVWSDGKERGNTQVEAGKQVPVKSLAVVATDPAKVTLKQSVSVHTARRYGKAAWPGVKDADAVRADLTLAPGDTVSLVLERPDGGCIYRLEDGFASLPCLDPNVAAIDGEPKTVWRAGTPIGMSGGFDWDEAAWEESPASVFTR